MKQLFTFIFLISATFHTLNAQNIGAEAPDFTLQDTNGNNFTLSEQDGKVVFVFLLGYSCPFCINASSSIQTKILNEFAGMNNFVAVGIDTWNGSKSQVQNFQAVTGLSMPILQKGGNVASSWSTTYDRLVVIDKNGIMQYKGTQSAAASVNAAKAVITDLINMQSTGINDINGQNEVLAQNFPNPVNGTTRIVFNLNNPGNAELRIYNITGELVDLPLNKYLQAGEHSININTDNYSPGIYIYSLESDGKNHSKRMIVK